MADSGDSTVLLDIVTEVERALGGGIPVAVATVMDAGDQGLVVGTKMLVRRDANDTALGSIDNEGPVDAAIHEAAQGVFAAFPRVQLQMLYVGREHDVVTRRSQARPGDARLMLELFEAPARLVISGGGHVGLSLATVGRFLGFNVVVIDDRAEFANAERFPMASEILCGDVGEMLDAMTLDATCSVVLVSRGHTVDTLALRHSVGRGAGYIGMIGSRRRTGTVLQMLRDEGIDAEELAQVHTPIGLDIGAETPEEIAVAIMAEIILIRKGGSGRMLSTLTNRRQSERLGTGTAAAGA